MNIQSISKICLSMNFFVALCFLARLEVMNAMKSQSYGSPGNCGIPKASLPNCASAANFLTPQITRSNPIAISGRGEKREIKVGKVLKKYIMCMMPAINSGEREQLIKDFISFKGDDCKRLKTYGTLYIEHSFNKWYRKKYVQQEINEINDEISRHLIIQNPQLRRAMQALVRGKTQDTGTEN